MKIDDFIDKVLEATSIPTPAEIEAAVERCLAKEQAGYDKMVLGFDDMWDVERVKLPYMFMKPVLTEDGTEYDARELRARRRRTARKIEGIDSERSSDDSEGDDFTSPTDYQTAEHVFLHSNGQAILAWEYLGNEWSDRILNVHKLGPLDTKLLPPMLVDPHKHQLIGINKILALCETPFKGAIIADEVGVGKTLTAATSAEILRLRFGGFTLIVGPKTALNQWRRELINYYGPDTKVAMITSSEDSILDLIQQGYGWGLCSYNFVVNRFRDRELNRTAYADLKGEIDANDLTFSSPKAKSHYYKTRKRLVNERPTQTLHTRAYEFLGVGITSLILDEAHVIKNPMGVTHKAVAAIQAKHVFVLTGTIFANQWYDVWPLVAMLRGHPFETRHKFMRAFASKQDTSTSTDPSESKQRRLIKFLEFPVISRPASVMALPKGIQHVSREFQLGSESMKASVQYCARLFYGCLRNGSIPATQVTGEKGSKRENQALSWISRAQMLTANEHMLSPAESKKIDAIAEQAMQWANESTKSKTDVDRLGDIEADSPQFYYKLLETLERDRSRKLTKKAISAQSIPAKMLDSGVSGERPSKMLKDNAGKAISAPKAEDQARGQSIGQSEDDVDIFDDAAINKLIGEWSVLDPNPDEDDDADVNELETNDAVVGIPFNTTSKSTSKEASWWQKKLAGLSPGQIMSPRVQEITIIVQHIKDQYPGEKVLIFSKFKRQLDLVDKALHLVMPGKVRVYRYDGNVPNDSRPGVLRSLELHRDPDKVGVLLTTMGCGGASLNMAFASHVVLCEPWWCDSQKAQAIGRAYRTGQDKTVWVYNVMAADSCVDHLLNKSRDSKARVINEVMAHLRRTDDAEITIPEQVKGKVG